MNTAASSKEVVYSILTEVTGKPESEILPSAQLVDLLEDSIQLFELVLKLEEVFQTPPDYTKLIDINTVGEAISFVEENYFAKK